LALNKVGKGGRPENLLTHYDVATLWDLNSIAVNSIYGIYWKEYFFPFYIKTNTFYQKQNDEDGTNEISLKRWVILYTDPLSSQLTN
jgi:hypothetical protein